MLRSCATSLSHLTYLDVRKIPGPSCDRLLREGGRREIDLESQVKLRPDRLVVELEDGTATLKLTDRQRGRIEASCSVCEIPCEHLGAAFSLVLEEKLALGLAAPRPRRTFRLRSSPRSSSYSERSRSVHCGHNRRR